MRKDIWCRLGFHKWAFAHTSEETGVAVMNGRWVSRSFTVDHYLCLCCGKWK